MEKKTLEFKKIGYGFLAHTHNDGRAEFCPTLEAAKAVEGIDRGEFLGVNKGYIIQHDSPHGGSYGFEWHPTSYEGALADAQEAFGEEFECVFEND